MSTRGNRMTGDDIIKSIATMHERSNGLGGGFAAYGIYPNFKDHFAFHLIYHNQQSQLETEALLKQKFIVDESGPIPTRIMPQITDPPILWRYFVQVDPEKLFSNGRLVGLRDYVVGVVMYINNNVPGAFVASSGQNMGAFKGVGYPEDIGLFYRLDEYEAYIWTSHGRFPTNTPGWWGGAHPFCLLDFSVVHNGEISSYGINRRYLESFGYCCELQTDTEVVAYMFDLLHRRHNIPFDITCRALAAPFWKNIDMLEEEDRQMYTAIRQVYGSAMLNGPFSFIVANKNNMVALNDRIKLRPMTCGVKGEYVYMASEESAIREICPDLDRVWSARAGEPIIASLEEGITV
jgi:glutamate synthase domain-containing protein 1